VLASMDETTPEESGGVYYVVAATVLLLDRDDARSALKAVVDEKGRRRPFHWSREGSDTRNRMIECIQQLGAVAHVCVHFPTGRKKQEEARALGIATLVPRLIEEGVDELLIESRGGGMSDDRDKRVILSTMERIGKPGAFAYDWHTKQEELLWPADAVCGAVREYLLSEDVQYYDRLRGAGVITEPIYINASMDP
jgi:hypothetical protein